MLKIIFTIIVLFFNFIFYSTGMILGIPIFSFIFGFLDSRDFLIHLSDVPKEKENGEDPNLTDTKN